MQIYAELLLNYFGDVIWHNVGSPREPDLH